MGRKPILDPKRLLSAIEHEVRSSGNAPTMRDLARKLGGVSTRTIHRYVEKLEQDGWIERGSAGRSVRILRSSAPELETVAVPLVGEAPAGPMMLAEENHEGWLRLPRSFVRPGGAHFLLRVRGDSMNRARVDGGYIEDKDLVLVRQQPTATPGDIVVAMIDGEATIKRFQRGSGFLVLKPESKNPKHHPIVATTGLQIQGVVKKVLKKGSTVFE